MRKLMLAVVVCCACTPLMGCHGGDDGGENKVIQSKGGSPPVEKPADPSRVKPTLSTSGGGAGK